jgi:hypothetical protein
MDYIRNQALKFGDFQIQILIEMDPNSYSG